MLSLRSFPGQDIDYTKGLASLYANIDWTSEKIKHLNDMYTTATLSIQCNQTNGLRFKEVEWKELQAPKIPKIEPSAIETCSAQKKSLRNTDHCDQFGECIYEMRNLMEYEVGGFRGDAMRKGLETHFKLLLH